MIGSGLKKLAKENGMRISNGVAYGSLGGFAATLSEGAGWKQIVFTTYFTDHRKMEELAEFTDRMNVSRRYRVQNLNITPRSVQVIFHDNPGTMKKIREFLDWFLPLLNSHGAGGMNVCTECGMEITDARWILVEGAAFYVHDACAQKIAREIETENSQRAEEAAGSYGLGLLGALLGSAVGAVVWAIVLNLGYVASIVGLLIGWLAEKGYNLLHGKQGKAKVVILILAIIFGVLLGTFAADAMTLMGMINGGELPGFAMGDIPGIIIVLLADDAEYRSAMMGNILTGLLFAALGVFALLRKAGKDVADTKYVELK